MGNGVPTLFEVLGKGAGGTPTGDSIFHLLSILMWAMTMRPGGVCLAWNGLPDHTQVVPSYRISVLVTLSNQIKSNFICIAHCAISPGFGKL